MAYPGLGLDYCGARAATRRRKAREGAGGGDSGAGRAGGKGGRGKAADALALLKQDHDKVKKAFKQLEKMEGSGRDAQALPAQVIAERKLHAAVREAIGDDAFMNEAVVDPNRS